MDFTIAVEYPLNILLPNLGEKNSHDAMYMYLKVEYINIL